MATAKPQRPTRPGPRRHYLRNGLIAAVLLVGLAIAVFGQRLQTQALLATAYGARIACTCHYLAARNLTDCRQDFEPGMAMVSLRDDAPTHSITARIPLIASQTATFREGQGCQLQSWTP